MTNLSNQKKIAAHILKVGVNRVWMDPDASDEIVMAIRREDIKGLIEKGVIKAKQKKGVSRARARVLAAKRKYGHRKGHGKRKGKKGARAPRKELWMKKIRALRRRLKEHRDNNEISRYTYRKLYRKAKGGEFRNVAHLDAYIFQSSGR
ncbi:MAG: 50S ribosomal protein L19e [Methanosarcinales archaeon]